MLGLLALVGCAPDEAVGSGSAPGRSQGGPEERVDQLVEAFQPLDRTVTSDISDVKLQLERELQAELSKAGPEVGRAALARLQRPESKAVDVERALLTVAAHAATADTLPLLESLLLQYGADIHLRTEGMLLLSDVAPARAIELLEPLVTRQKHESTMPPQEFMVKAWVTACDKTGRSPVPELCNVATNLFQDTATRVLAVKELGRRRDPRGEAALRAILIESTGDGYLRRKVVQSLHAILPAETACVLFREVASKEADMNFLRFLADAIGDWCGD